MNDFDGACRWMVKEQPQAFFRWLFQDFDRLARHTEWVDTRRLAFPRRGEHSGDQTGDLVAELEIRTAPQPRWALALEFQIEPDADMFGRMMSYLGKLWLERHPDNERSSRYQLASCVINLTGTSRSAPASASYIWPGADDVQTVLKVRERYLAEESAVQTLEAIERGEYNRALLPWIPLMQQGCEAETLTRWRALAESETNPRWKASYGVQALLFAEKSADAEVWNKALEGWGMIKSQFLEAHRAEARNQGRTEGRAEGQRGLLLRLLQRRLDTMDPELIRRIEATTDEATLQAWFDLAMTAAPDEIRQQILGS
jgi:predicted transposase YdaD